ncbi:DNA mismatch repair protein MutS [Chitinophagales bacterium]|nr:DNA mismatch repair protein MutS [Chitinophagales bacterium]
MATVKTKAKAKKKTPLMTQYGEIKAKYPDAILLFRVGDFYETFGQDAITIAGALGITLTKRANGSAAHIELAGFPHHSVDTYLPRLVRAGFRVAICEQLEDPKKTKNIVKRGVTELVTPGVVFNDQLLDHKSNNFLASVFFLGNKVGLAFLDATTGEFFVTEGSAESADKFLQSFQPSELLCARDQRKQLEEAFGKNWYSYYLDEWVYNTDYSVETLLRQFGTTSLKGFGVQNLEAAVIAAGSIIHYLDTTEHKSLTHINTMSRLAEDRFVWLDRFTIRNLELVGSSNEGAATLLSVLDDTVSAMGARLLRKWVLLPLKELPAINERLDLVDYFLEKEAMSNELTDSVKQIGDLERLVGKIPLQRIGPREVIQLKRSMDALVPIKAACMNSSLLALQSLGEKLNECPVMLGKIAEALVDEPPVALGKGAVIRPGYHEELDEYRSLSENGKEHLEKIRLREMERTGITSLKVGYNGPFGYYLEVTNRFKEQVPEDWTRKQTLTNAERYITPELKEYEAKILEAEGKVSEWEGRLYRELLEFLVDYIRPIQINAYNIARLDCLLCFARLSSKYDYTRPSLNDGLEINVKMGRHPVIERQLTGGGDYIPNDLFLSPDEQQIIILTGPNMSGKSALLRQTALISLMAQMGCFVPAESAELGLIDRVFTRVGASDNISSGESTFMVEMNETASIMNNLSERSLVILDEIGRGTSTYDGISIAWSLVEYLNRPSSFRPKTLFATHYHELNELADRCTAVKNYHISTREVGKKVLFLRKLVEGGTEHSFGIHVARMAGMPPEVVERAAQVLVELESQRAHSTSSPNLKTVPKQDLQLQLFSMDNPELQEIRDFLVKLDLNRITPIEAMLKLKELKELSVDKKE